MRRRSIHPGLCAALIAALVGVPGLAQELADPLRPPGPAFTVSAAEDASAQAGYSLQATQIARVGKWAIINGRAVAEGEALNAGTRVASIQHGSVLLERAEGPLTLYVTPPIRQPRAASTSLKP